MTLNAGASSRREKNPESVGISLFTHWPLPQIRSHSDGRNAASIIAQSDTWAPSVLAHSAELTRSSWRTRRNQTHRLARRFVGRTFSPIVENTTAAACCRFESGCANFGRCVEHDFPAVQFFSAVIQSRSSKLSTRSEVALNGGVKIGLECSAGFTVERNQVFAWQSPRLRQNPSPQRRQGRDGGITTCRDRTLAQRKVG